MSRPKSSATAVNSAITEDVTACNTITATTRRPSDVTSSYTAPERFDGHTNVDPHKRSAHDTLGVGTWTDDHPEPDYNDEVSTNAHAPYEKCSSSQVRPERRSSASSSVDVADDATDPTKITTTSSCSQRVFGGSRDTFVSGEMCDCEQTADDTCSGAAERDGAEVNGVIGKPSEER